MSSGSIDVGSTVNTKTLPNLAPVIYASFEPQEIAAPKGYIGISDLISELEKDDKSRAAISKSRKWVADTFYDKSSTLAALRLRKGLSQASLAEKIGTSQSHYARIESGKDDPRFSTIEKIAGGLEVDLIAVVNAVKESKVKR